MYIIMQNTLSIQIHMHTDFTHIYLQIDKFLNIHTSKYS